MNLFKNALILSSLVLTFSCAHHHKHSCCGENGPKACVEGQCKADKSCCDDKCGECTGEKGACKSGNCKSDKTA